MNTSADVARNRKIRGLRINSFAAVVMLMIELVSGLALIFTPHYRLREMARVCLAPFCRRLRTARSHLIASITTMSGPIEAGGSDRPPRVETPS
jgi:hypothetical protein